MANKSYKSQKAAAKAAKTLLNQTSVKEGKSQADTVKIWENFREQAMLWRALALLQIPGTLIALFFALVMWWNRETILNVPAKPLPGYYQAYEIPDAEFISVATNYVNLVSTYQPTTAARQFQEAEKYLTEPIITTFATDMKQNELKAIENTRRTQTYYVDPTQTEITRNENDGTVAVYFKGEREKIVAGQSVPGAITQFLVKMTTIPRNTLNEYGIVIYNVETTSSAN